MRPLFGSILAVAAWAAIAWLQAGACSACPICNGIATTLSDEIGKAQIVVFATLEKPAPVAEEGSLGLGNPPDATFRIARVLKGADVLEEFGGPQEFTALYYGNQPVETEFLVYGRVDVVSASKESDEEIVKLSWTTPTALTPRAAEYLVELASLPAKGDDRLAFFMRWFEDSDRLASSDSYDEFAKAPYDEIVRLKEIMPHEKLVAWATDAQVPSTHRRLYLMLLGICGSEDDALIVESLIENEDRQFRITLDAAVACYLNLRGAEGLPLIDKLFLANEAAEYTDVYAAIMSLRFQQEFGTRISRDRLLESMRLLLDRPKFADLIIPDLARAQDWSAIDKLAQLFKDATKTSYVRVPIFNYLRQCPLAKAKTLTEELAAIDPKAYKQAIAFYPTRKADGVAEKEQPGQPAGGAKAGETGDAKAGETEKTNVKADAPASSG